MAGAHPVRVLMLHGFNQSGDVFRSKAGAFRKALTGALNAAAYTAPPLEVTFVVPDAAHIGEEGRFRWWNGVDRKDLSAVPEEMKVDLNDPSESQLEGTRVLVGLPQSIRYLQTLVQREGPFDGVVGFSQGAMLTSFLCALQGIHTCEDVSLSPIAEQLRQSSTFNFKWAILVGGFIPDDDIISPTLKAFSRQHKERTVIPTLHLYGAADSIVRPDQSTLLFERIRAAEPERAQSFIHKDGHIIPGNAAVKAAITEFFAVQGKRAYL